MKKENETVIGKGTVLRGNFAPRGSNKGELSAEPRQKTDEVRRTEEFEKVARERIGGSIAFVTRFKEGDQDPLLWEGEDD